MTGDRSVVVVRHALAVDKRSWRKPDRERPLDPDGERDARSLVDELTTVPIRRLVSSAAWRCLQTLHPLAERSGLTIERSERLGKDTAPDAFLALVVDAGSADTVLCTHGEVMRPLLRAVRRDGIEISAGRRGDDTDHWRLLAKGTAWRLTISSGGDIEHLQHIVPRRLA